MTARVDIIIDRVKLMMLEDVMIHALDDDDFGWKSSILDFYQFWKFVGYLVSYQDC